MVSKWSTENLQPIAAKIDLENKFDRKLWAEMGSLGLLGITVPEEYGGTGLGYTE